MATDVVRDAFIGIDVAFAKGKPLPVVASVLQDGALVPLPLNRAQAQPPRGEGNLRSLESDVRDRFALGVRDYLREMENEFSIRIVRIAIDAPSAPCADGSLRRACEAALDQKGISCIATPTLSSLDGRIAAARAHMQGGGSEARLPGANQFWMLIGFDLFRVLGKEWECIEVYPQAIAVTLGAAGTHKRHAEGLSIQLRRAAEHTGWPASFDAKALSLIARGAPHDRLDAYLASWVASLPEEKREAIGVAPHDAIWVPRIGAARATMLSDEPATRVERVDQRQHPTYHKVARKTRESRRTTEVGYENDNGQTVVAPTGKPGTDHGQSIYVLRCGKCNGEYGVNGSGIFQSKCPYCQGGKARLAY